MEKDSKDAPKEIPATHDESKNRHINLEHGRWIPGTTAKGQPERHVSNVIKTSKYNPYTFVFQNLLEQFLRPANAYFLMVAVLQGIKQISISQGQPTILLPLTFVIAVSMVKDAYEDYRRQQADKRENETEYNVWKDPDTELVSSADIQVGDLVKVLDDETFPADLLLILTGSEDGVYGYVETANLDGETNLKIKSVPEPLKGLEVAKLPEMKLQLTAEPPSGKLDSFGGLVRYNEGKEGLIGIDNLLLRGAKLKNTNYVFGLVIYTGEESKIRMNSSEKKKARVKRSKVEQYTNKQMRGTVLMQIVVCFFAGLGTGTWEDIHSKHTWYLGFDNSPAVSGIERFFTWFIIFAYLVPISLLVSMEMVKFWQGMFMGWDMKMSYVIGQERQFARAQTSGLNEELGYVQYVLSDKTGTLTCNSMDFRKCVIGGVQYGTGDTDISRAAKQRRSIGDRREPSVVEADHEHPFETVPHVHFNHRLKMGQEMRRKNEHAKQIHEYLCALSLSNTVFPSISESGRVVLKASSPDEQALVEFARFIGYELYERNPPQVQIHIRLPNDEKNPAVIQNYEQLAVLDFTSKRKRMSVVVRTPEGKVKMYTKGADSLIQPLLRGAADGDESLMKAQPDWQKTLEHLARFGDQGLRTLLVAVATRDADWWDNKETGWERRYQEGMKECAVEGPAEEGHFKGGCKASCRRCNLEEALEKDAGLDLIGATAIEDKLQDHVPSCIKAMLDGGLNVWVLTGDKLETAINIGMACNLLESSMERKGNLLRIDSENPEEIKNQIDAHVSHLRWLREESKSTAPVGLVVTSQAFAVLMNSDKEVLNRFLWVATRCKSVVGCRMQPNQKAQIVNLVKTTQNATTLAIGDGANDEQMIREADVGVGIRGVEGTSAVRAADYAISQFSFLRRLLFVHGRLNYRRISILISYIFYKNIVITFVPLWYGIVSGFSGQSLFLTWAYQGYNIVFTAFPILAFAVLDRDVDHEVLERNPKIYGLTQHGELFNVIIFWKWIILGLIQSGVMFYVPFAVYGYDVAMDNTGQSYGLWEFGVVIYTVIIVVMNLKLALLCKSWTWLHHLTIWGSLFLYYIALLILGSSPIFSNAGADYTGSITRLYGTPRYWLTTLITVILSLYIDYFIFALDELDISKHLLPSSWETWLKETFPTHPPPDPAYFPASLPPPKKNPASEEAAAPALAVSLPTSPSSSEHLAPPLEKVSPERKMTASPSARSSHLRTHTGFDFDPPPHETYRMGRRSSKSTSSRTEERTPSTSPVKDALSGDYA